nr:adenylate kinase [uncultured Oscillibacter sp.]
MLWHNPDRTTCSPERFDAELDKVLAKDCWIMDGNYQRTAERRLAACDTAFLLDFPLELCLAGAEARIGKKREDMPWVETVFDAEFRQWILDFPQTKLPEHYRLLERYREGREIVVFRSRMEMERYLNVLTG